MKKSEVNNCISCGKKLPISAFAEQPNQIISPMCDECWKLERHMRFKIKPNR